MQVLGQGLRCAEAGDSLHAEARRAEGLAPVLRALSQPHRCVVFVAAIPHKARRMQYISVRQPAVILDHILA